MKIACIQTNPQDHLKTNINQMLELVEQAAHAGATFIVLPEIFSFMGSTKDLLKNADDLNSGSFLGFQECAKNLGVFIVAGSLIEKTKDSQFVYNTSLSFSPQGELLNIYRKLHLFNLLDSNGNKIYCERDIYLPGSSPVPYQATINNEDWKLMTCICYDIRFPEIIRNQPENIDILFVPAAFTWQTGHDHWEVLLRARAIENQCYVVACNQTGFYAGGSKRNYGHSMIIDPWGKVIAQLNEDVDILYADIYKQNILETRLRLPALNDRKIK